MRFYVEVFGCEPVPPQRDQQGAWLDTATSLSGAHLQGMHLRLPGGELDGPTLEIYSYELEMIYLRDPEGNIIELQAWQADDD